MKSLKGITAKRANSLLGLTGTTFWQEESYDRLIRDRDEFETVRNYIEDNPVRAGIVRQPADFRWSSAWNGGPTGASAGGPGGPPYGGGGTDK